MELVRGGMGLGGELEFMVGEGRWRGGCGENLQK